MDSSEKMKDSLDKMSFGSLTQEKTMIILPTTTPAVLADVNNNNQTVHQHIQNAEQSKKASDTVQVSAQARKMAGSELDNKPAASFDPLTVQKAADNEVAEKVADNEIAEAQRPSNPVTQKPETSKIDVVA